MNGKDFMKTIAAVLAGAAAGVSVAENASKDDKRSVICNGYCATYGMAINAVTKSKMSSYWKNSVIEAIPRDCSDPGLYAAVISIMEDDSMSDYWKNSAVEELFS